jgi:hypothetical protein
MRPKRWTNSWSQDACRHRDAKRLLLDLDVDAELAEHFVDTGVEVRDRQPVSELEGPRAAVRGPDDQGVIEEVQGDLEGGVALMQPSGREPTNVDVERDVPPVVARRRRREADLPEDLAVEMQSVLRRPPVAQVQFGKCHGVPRTNPRLSM